MKGHTEKAYCRSEKRGTMSYNLLHENQMKSHNSNRTPSVHAINRTYSVVMMTRTLLLISVALLSATTVCASSSRGARDLSMNDSRRASRQQQHRELALGVGVAQVLSHETDKRSKKSGSKGSKKSSSSSSSKKSSSSNSNKKSGSSKGDNIFSHSRSSSSSSDADDDDQLPSDGSPTPPPIGFPSSPTPAPRPTIGGPTGPGRDPTETFPPGGPTDGFPEPRCSVSSEGLFGSQLGLAEETEFFYQATVVPSVTAAELDLDILGRVENLMAGFVLSGLFARCADIDAQPSKLRRVLQDAGNIEGWSLRPRDTVVEGAECVGSQGAFPCFVVRGRATSYTDGKITEATSIAVSDAIERAFEEGRLSRADNRLLSVTYRDDERFPLDGSAPTESPNSDGGPGVRSGGDGDGDDGGLETWAIALIAVGGAIACLMAYICLRGRSQQRGVIKSSSDSSSSSGSSYSTLSRQKDVYLSPVPVARPPVTQAYQHPVIEDPPQENTKPDQAWTFTPAVASRDAFHDEPSNDGNNSRFESESSGSSVEEESFPGEDSYHSGSGSRSQSEMEEESVQDEDEDNFGSHPQNEAGAMTTTMGFEDFEGHDDFDQSNNAFSESGRFGHQEVTEESVGSSYEEEYEDEYEIEYVSDGEGGMPDEEEVHEELWEDEVVEDEEDALLSWISPTDNDNAFR